MKKLRIKTKVWITIAAILIIFYCLFIFSNHYKAIYYPETPQQDISHILTKASLTSSDYSLLLSQTGLGKPALEDLLKTPDGISRIQAIQKNYYSKNKIITEKLNAFTRQESLVLEGINNTSDFGMAPIKNGDILLTKSTHTLFWRHGHCGIVIDADKGITLESLEPGTISTKQSLSKWQYYSTLKVMRLKNVESVTINNIVKYAEEKLLGKKYSILALKKKGEVIPDLANCSQLIWQAFINFGYDLDSNKGLIVTPENIAKSPLLEVVQIRGFNPDRAW